MTKLNCMLYLIVCSFINLDGQSIIKQIEQKIIEDSLKYKELELGIKQGEHIFSENNRYHLFKVKLKLNEESYLSNGETNYFTPKTYFIFDIIKNQYFELDLTYLIGKIYKYRFAKIYDSKIVIIYSFIAENNLLIDEFNLIGQKINSKKGICPTINLCKCYDLNSDYVIWINDKMNLLNLETNELKVLAKLNLTQGADNNYYGAPKIELDYANRKILVKDYEIHDKDTSFKDYITKKLIKPIAEYKIIDNVLVFNF